ncbi:MAG: SRPBCC domain-containing protein [Sulfitobacter sp.]
MSDLRLERDFPVPPSRLFEVLSKRAELVRWWGHDGWTFVSEHMDFTKTGPWYADMRSEEGNKYKLSGQVTKVAPPDTIGFTWAWHDPDDNRGHESHVTFTVVETAQGSRLIVDHRELQSDDIAGQHARGWSAPLSCLERMLKDET